MLARIMRTKTEQARTLRTGNTRIGISRVAVAQVAAVQLSARVWAAKSVNPQGRQRDPAGKHIDLSKSLGFCCIA